MSLDWIYTIIIIYSTNNYLLIKTSVPSSGWCSSNFSVWCCSWQYFQVKVNASGAAASQMLMLVDGWLPQGHGPVLAPIDGALPRQSQHKARALTWRHRALMMIDHVVFFITLNPISACCNLSNDGSLLAIAEFKGFFILPHQWTLGDTIKGSMIFLFLHTHYWLGNPISTVKFKPPVTYTKDGFVNSQHKTSSRCYWKVLGIMKIKHHLLNLN